MNRSDLVFRLKKRAEIRRQIATRKSVQEGKPDRLAELLDEAAAGLEELILALEDTVEFRGMWQDTTKAREVLAKWKS